eukprot:TRINITY_DN15535_c0_g1_i4.p1 TRINITY_DN15535_c0_g1~~TRINITY_DN15535_c0_g1_i4.p1  ORF type:complete len:223 (+),score=20.94 TRINITY_DN15535_c0_g1_i4:86-670(+)
MAKWLGRFRDSLENRPMLANLVAAGSLGVVGDLLCQVMVEQRETVEARRTFAVSMFCGLYQGPVCSTIYASYPRYFPAALTSTQLRSGLSCAVADNFGHVPFLYIPAFYMSVGVLQGSGWSASMESLKADWAQTVVDCWKLWIPLQLLNFSVVPLHMRVLFMNVACLFWNVYLSSASTAIPTDTATIAVDDAVK